MASFPLSVFRQGAAGSFYYLTKTVKGEKVAIDYYFIDGLVELGVSVGCSLWKSILYVIA